MGTYGKGWASWRKDLKLDPEFDWLLRGHKLELSRNAAGYCCIVATHPKTGRQSVISRIITDCPDGMVVDHINGDPLDNRRENLRICSRSENNRNKAAKPGCSSRYKGVSESKGKWQAGIAVDYRQISLGTYSAEIDAAHAYDEAARILHGDFAALNFAKEGERSAHRPTSNKLWHSI